MICDCGNPATRKGQCARCEFLDGPIVISRDYVVPEIIATLRLHGELPLAQIIDEIKAPMATVQRALYRMMTAERVARWLETYVAPERQVHVAGKTRRAYNRAQIDTAQRWVYYLTAPKEMR